MAYRLSREIVRPAAAQAENTAPKRMRAATANPARAATETIQSVAKAPRAPISLHPTLISRAGPAASEAAGSEAAGPPALIRDVAMLDTDADEWAGYEPWTPNRTDLYRTVCVRLCDGSSFPMSFGTTRDRFKVDAVRCQKGCGSPARLFVSKLPSEALEDLVDVHGTAYADLPNAFKFQTAYDAACSCRSQPWEEASREHHRKLAVEAQAVKLANAKPDLPPAATHRGQPNVPVEIAMLEPGQPAPIPAHPNLPALAVATGTVVSNHRPAEAPAGKLSDIAAHDLQAKSATPKRVSIAAVAPSGAADAEHEPKQSKVAPAPTSVPKPVVKALRGVPAAAKIVASKPQPQLVARKPAPAALRPPQAAAVAKPVVRPAPSREVIARANGASRAQRAFRSDDYWRLSYWEPRN